MADTIGLSDLNLRDGFLDSVGVNLGDKAAVMTGEKGVPVLINPTLMVNTEAKTDLLQRDIVIDGVNGFDYV